MDDGEGVELNSQRDFAGLQTNEGGVRRDAQMGACWKTQNRFKCLENG
jgi:hypothetical protein